MMSRKKAPLICEVNVNIWGYGSDDVKIEFNTLHTISRLHTYFATVLEPTQIKFYELAEGDVRLKEVEKAEEEFRCSFRNKKQKYLERAQATLIEELCPTLNPIIQNEIRKLTERVFISTLKQAKNEIAALAKVDPKRKPQQVIRDYKKFDRLRGRRPKIGRPKGSKIHKSHSEVLHIHEERKGKILKAIQELYGAAKNTDFESRKAVAGRIGITSRTLANWIKEGSWDWDKLIEQGERGNKNSS